MTFWSYPAAPPSPFRLRTLANGAKQSAPLLKHPATAARMFGGFTSSYEAKNASTSEAPSPSHSKRAAFAFDHGKRGN
ncbi:hypothetical protein COK37_12155 [Bacillus thuringiensis]|nr:hypothetical protein CN432_13390 [Bacillus thuringiensis]PEZ37400.1 hypothetical protein CN346_08700 [Bacillus thuringiensis]PFF79062.1 hypothetical protein CN339_05500 [Bacillus thuringiensis]PFR68365.1 hypothetical protein COK37_12155 [Bacillus thuringiensis]PFT76345.1 hypothetical protein COK70_24110 [Bacillus thuringiensis]